MDLFPIPGPFPQWNTHDGAGLSECPEMQYAVTHSLVARPADETSHNIRVINFHAVTSSSKISRAKPTVWEP